MARLQVVYGEKVTFDIANSPSIVLQIPKKDAHIAKLVFHGEESNFKEKEPSTKISAVAPTQTTISHAKCPVCDDNEPEDTMKMSCGHVYHRVCFEFQVGSVGEHDLPLRCCYQENALDIRSRCSHVSSD